MRFASLLAAIALSRAVGAQGNFGWSSGFETRGVSDFSPVNVSALQTFDFGSGEVLLVGGRYTMAGRLYSPYLSAWTDAGWQPLRPQPPGYVEALFAGDDGSGLSLYAGLEWNSVWRLTAEGWIQQGGLGGPVYAMALCDVAAHVQRRPGSIVESGQRVTGDGERLANHAPSFAVPDRCRPGNSFSGARKGPRCEQKRPHRCLHRQQLQDIARKPLTFAK